MDEVVKLSRPTKSQCELYACQRKAPVIRLIRCVTRDNQVRVLATNLLNADEFPTDAFYDLYHERWRVEEAFKRHKHRLKVEAVTGLSEQAVRQDLMAKIVADNLARMIAHRIDEQTEENQRGSQRKTNINRTSAIHLMRIYLGQLLVKAWEGSTAQKILDWIYDALARTRRTVAQGRSYLRPKRVKLHAKAGYKS